MSEGNQQDFQFKSSVVDQFIMSYRFLVDKGILTNLGVNKDGLYYLVVYGTGYS